MQFSTVLRDLLKTWKLQRNDRIKLQHAYLFIAFCALVASGLISLLNVTWGRRIALLAAVALAVFLLNGLIWAVLYATVMSTQIENDTKPVSAAVKPGSKKTS